MQFLVLQGNCWVRPLLSLSKYAQGIFIGIAWISARSLINCQCDCISVLLYSIVLMCVCVCVCVWCVCVCVCVRVCSSVIAAIDWVVHQHKSQSGKRSVAKYVQLSLTAAILVKKKSLIALSLPIASLSVLVGQKK